MLSQTKQKFAKLLLPKHELRDNCHNILFFSYSSGIENMVSSGIVAKGRFFITAEKSKLLGLFVICSIAFLTLRYS